MSVLARIAVYCVLVLLGIPWYWPQADTRIVLGVPAWVLVAVLAGFIASVFTAWCLRRENPP